jgi:TonB-linked SusC/RagA family outer membrane protein
MRLKYIMQRLSAGVLLLFFLSGGLVQAQNRILLRGKVVNKADKAEELIGVSVAELDKDNRSIRGVTTDLNGNYSITVNNTPGQKLVFSFIGFKSETVAIGTTAVINVELEEESTQLGAVEIVAQRKASVGALNVDERDLSGSYSRVEARDLESLPVTSIDQALQGRMSGVDIVASSGQPGAGMSIRIRGTTSINNQSDPLIVVNGIPYETTISDDFDFATADEESYSQLLNISPSDILEISVLKDAASTAQYGSRGASGVLMIRTKRGSMGKPRVTYNFKGTVSVPQNSISTLNGDEYSTLMLESFMNAGRPIDLVAYPEFARDPNNPYYFYNYGQNTDWVDLVQQTSFKQDHNIALAGGGQKAQYRISTSFLDEKGNIKKTGLNRFTTRLSLDYSISDKLRVRADVDYTHTERYQPYAKDILSRAFTKMPNQAVYEYNELGEQTTNYFSPERTPQGNFSGSEGVYNPMAMIDNSSNISTDDRVRPTFVAQYDIIPGKLRYSGNVTFDIITNRGKTFLPQSATGVAWTENSVNRGKDSESEAFLVNIENMLVFTPTIAEGIEFQGLGKFVTSDKRSESLSVETSNSASVYLPEVGSGRLISPNSGRSQERNLQGTAIAHWKFFDKYVIDGVLTVEGNSRFGGSHRFGLFPSISGRWRVSGESFLKDVKRLNDLSLRASYGVSGKAPGKNYLHFNRYSAYDYSYLGTLGVRPSSMELADLRWERTGELNLGANLIMFNNRLNIDFDYYRRETTDLMFSSVGIPSISGVSSIDMNVGTLSNSGWELGIDVTPYQSDDWQVDLKFTFSQTKNRILELSDNVPLTMTPTATNNKYMSRIQEGHPLGSFYGYRSKGVYLNADETVARDKNGNKIYTYDMQGNQVPVGMKFWYPSVAYDFQPGDAKYEDVNYDGNIDYMDIVYLGNASPRLLGGFGPSVRYKRFRFDCYFFYRFGFDIVNQTKIDMEKMNNFDNQSTATLRRWRRPYDNPADAPADLLPRALYGMGYNYLGSDRFVEDASFLKFKSLTVRYNLDREWLQKFSFSDASVSFTAYNLYTWTRYTGMNPEVNARPSASEGGIFSIGYDKSRAPSNIEFSLSLNLTF